MFAPSVQHALPIASSCLRRALFVRQFFGEPPAGPPPKTRHSEGDGWAWEKILSDTPIQPVERAADEAARWAEAEVRRAEARGTKPKPIASILNAAKQKADAAAESSKADAAASQLPAGRFQEASRPPLYVLADTARGLDATRRGKEAKERGPMQRVLEFDMTPREVKAHLDEHVIAQEEAKRALSVAVCDHYNFVRRQLADPTLAEERSKPNLLLLGPSGVGKTHLLRAVTKLLGVPFVTGDATKFSATGCVAWPDLAVSHRPRGMPWIELPGCTLRCS